MHRRPTTPPDGMVQRIFKYRSGPVNSAACKHGVDLESEARDAYVQDCLKKGMNIKVAEPGLVIHKNKPWFGASPDGIVQVVGSEENVGLIEIKCPYVCKEGNENVPENIQELIDSRKHFYLIHGGKVNRKHNYFFQIQAQMGIGEMQWCDFVIYYKVDGTNICDMKIVRVNFEKEVFNFIEKKVDDFFLRGVVPELLTRRVQKGQKLYPSSKVYKYSIRKIKCISQGPECSNAT